MSEVGETSHLFSDGSGCLGSAVVSSMYESCEWVR